MNNFLEKNEIIFGSNLIFWNCKLVGMAAAEKKEKKCFNLIMFGFLLSIKITTTHFKVLFHFTFSGDNPKQILNLYLLTS